MGHQPKPGSAARPPITRPSWSHLHAWWGELREGWNGGNEPDLVVMACWPMHAATQTSTLPVAGCM